MGLYLVQLIGWISLSLLKKISGKYFLCLLVMLLIFISDCNFLGWHFILLILYCLYPIMLWIYLHFFLLHQVLSLLIVIMTSASFYTSIITCNGFQLPTQQMAFVNFTGAFCCITLLISAVIYSLGVYRFPLLKRLPWIKLVSFFSNFLKVEYFFFHNFICHCKVDEVSNQTYVKKAYTVCIF